MDHNNHTMSSISINRVWSIIGLPAGIFLSEVIAMFLILLYKGPYGVTILIDATITTVLMFPLIYFLSYRPLLKHIAERKQAENILKARIRLMQLAPSLKLDELLQAVLDEIEALTGSTIGFFHFLEPDQKTLRLQAWSSNTIENLCKSERKSSHQSLDQAGVWANCIRQRQPVVHNDYASLPNRKGTPEGHASIIREITVPIIRNDQVVAILGVGNKPRDFTPSDMQLVSTLADFSWDIVERKQVEDALRASERKFRTLVSWTYDCELWIDPQGKVVYISPSCERITGYSLEDFIYDPDLLAHMVHPDDRQFYEEHERLYHDEKADIYNVEYRIIARDESERWIAHICRPLFGEDDRYLGRRVSLRDITRRKRAEKEIQERNQKEALLTQTIHNMQIDIARDLHDTIGQNIGYLRMKLEHFSETNLPARVDLKTEIRKMAFVADESYNLIRGTLDVLQSGGLADPITLFTQYANQIQERSPFRFNLSGQGEPRSLSPNQVRQLFFVFREALSNIEKHANASEASGELIWDHDTLGLRIVDNGRGFNLEDAKTGDHYGIKFMQERIESLNGVFSIQSKKGMGTSIKIDFPYN